MVPERSKDVLTGVPFEAVKLSPGVLSGIQSLGFTKLSPVQLLSIPTVLSGKDVLIQAKSGTGKTLVFVIAALEYICESPDGHTIILVPTREIAVQIVQVINSIALDIPGLKVHLSIGGSSYFKDKQEVAKSQIIVGTLGRIKQLIDERFIDLFNTGLFVLDEADRMVEEGFRSLIEDVLQGLSATCQILAVSATYPPDLENVLIKSMKTPEIIKVQVDSLELVGIEQYVCVLPKPRSEATLQKVKVETLVNLLENVEFSQCMIFANFQTRAESIAKFLTSKGWPSRSLSAHLDQDSRLQTLTYLQQMKCRLVVCTDLAARGIDIENVDMVISVDVAGDPSTYIHRVGRAGRFGGHGVAITLAEESKELEYMRSIVSTINISIRPLKPENLDILATDERLSLELLEGNGNIISDITYTKQRKDTDRADKLKGKKRGWKGEKRIEKENDETMDYKEISLEFGNSQLERKFNGAKVAVESDEDKPQKINITLASEKIESKEDIQNGNGTTGAVMEEDRIYSENEVQASAFKVSGANEINENEMKIEVVREYSDQIVGKGMVDTSLNGETNFEEKRIQASNFYFQEAFVSTESDEDVQENVEVFEVLDQELEKRESTSLPNMDNSKIQRHIPCKRNSLPEISDRNAETKTAFDENNDVKYVKAVMKRVGNDTCDDYENKEETILREIDKRINSEVSNKDVKLNIDASKLDMKSQVYDTDVVVVPSEDKERVLSVLMNKEDLKAEEVVMSKELETVVAETKTSYEVIKERSNVIEGDKVNKKINKVTEVEGEELTILEVNNGEVVSSPVEEELIFSRNIIQRMFSGTRKKACERKSLVKRTRSISLTKPDLISKTVEKSHTLESCDASKLSEKKRNFRPLKFVRKTFQRTVSLVIRSPTRYEPKSGKEKTTSDRYRPVTSPTLSSLEISPVFSSTPVKVNQSDLKMIEPDIIAKDEEAVIDSSLSKYHSVIDSSLSNTPGISYDKSVDKSPAKDKFMVEKVAEGVPSPRQEEHLVQQVQMLSDETLKKQTLIVTDSEHDLPGGLERKCIDAGNDNLLQANEEIESVRNGEAQGNVDGSSDPKPGLNYETAHNLWYMKYYDQLETINQYVQNCKYVREYNGLNV